MKTNPTVELVKVAYANGCMNFRTETIRDQKVFADSLKAIGQYNSFEPEEVFEAIKPHFQYFDWVVGREYSPVLYAQAKRPVNNSYGDAAEQYMRNHVVKMISSLYGLEGYPDEIFFTDLGLRGLLNCFVRDEEGMIVYGENDKPKLMDLAAEWPRHNRTRTQEWDHTGTEVRDYTQYENCEPLNPAHSYIRFWWD